jgi:superfamily I DNA/RNA helicase
LNEEVDWSFDVVRVKEGKELVSLANTIEKLLETNKPEQIRVLSALRTEQSLLSNFFGREPEGEREIWLRSQLRHESTKGKIRWRSIPKFKGLEEDVVVITDVNRQAQVFAKGLNKGLNDLLYVGLTRARFQTALMISDDLYPKAKSSHS